MKTRSYIIMCVLTIMVASIAFRIEVLNRRAGGVLPRREYYNGDPTKGLVTWRVSALVNEELWRKVKGPRDSSGMPVSRPLTVSEESQMRKDLREARVENELRSFVSSAGLLQYFFVPCLVILTLASLKIGKRGARQIMISVVPLIVAIWAGGLMFYRGYFTSLGR